jgi:hypothetical protein
MLESEEMSDPDPDPDPVPVPVSIAGKTSRAENRISLGKLNLLQGLHHHNEHGSFLSPHTAWHLYHHTQHDSLFTTLSMAALSPPTNDSFITTHNIASLPPHTAQHLYHYTEYDIFITTHSMSHLSPHTWHLYHHFFIQKSCICLDTDSCSAQDSDKRDTTYFEELCVNRSVIQCHTVSYSIIQYHTVSYSVIQCHTVSYSIIQYHTVSYSVIQCHRVSHSIIQFHTVSYSIIQYHTVLTEI